MATERNNLFTRSSDEEIEAERQEDLENWQNTTERPAESNFDPGTYGCHEAFHTAWVLLNAVAENLLAHPAIIKDEVWYRHAYKAHDELFRLYQEMGAGHLEAIPDEVRRDALRKLRPRK